MYIPIDPFANINRHDLDVRDDLTVKADEVREQVFIDTNTVEDLEINLDKV